MDENYLEKHLQERVKEQNEKITGLEKQLRDLSKSKTPTTLFYLFVATFTFIYILGMIRIYQKTTENTLIFEKGVAGLRVTQTELKERLTYTSIKADQIDTSVFRLQDKFDKAISEIRKEIRGKNNK